MPVSGRKAEPRHLRPRGKRERRRRRRRRGDQPASLSWYLRGSLHQVNERFRATSDEAIQAPQVSFQVRRTALFVRNPLEPSPQKCAQTTTRAMYDPEPPPRGDGTRATAHAIRGTRNAKRVNLPDFGPSQQKSPRSRKPEPSKAWVCAGDKTFLPICQRGGFAPNFQEREFSSNKGAETLGELIPASPKTGPQGTAGGQRGSFHSISPGLV